MKSTGNNGRTTLGSAKIVSDIQRKEAVFG